MPRPAQPTLTNDMLPPNVRPYVPEGLQPRDLPLWYAAFETGKQAALDAQATSQIVEAVTSRPKPERVRVSAPLPDNGSAPEPEPNYGDPEDEDSTLDALLNYARQARPQMDSAKLASIAPKHEEMGNWIRNKSLPSARLIDMILDGVVEKLGASVMRPKSDTAG